MLFVTARRRAAAGKNIFWTQRMKTHLYYGNGIVLFSLAGIVMLCWYLTGRPLTEIGLGWGRAPYDLTAVLTLAGFMALYLLDVLREAGSQQRREETRREMSHIGFLPSSATQFLNFIFLSVAAGFSEEIVYRGFMITYLLELLGPGGWQTGVALLFPAIAFGLGHFYQGTKAVVKIIAMAVLFGFFYLRTGTLWPLMLLHTAIDIFGGLMSWYLLSRR